MNVLGLTHFISSFFCVFFGLSIYSRRPQVRARNFLLAASFLFGYTAFTLGCYHQSLRIDEARFWWKLSSSWPLTAAVSYHFLILYTNQTQFISKLRLLFLYISSVVVTLIYILTNYVSEVVSRGGGWSIHYPVNVFSVFCQSWFVFLIFLAILTMFIAVLKSKTKRYRNQIIIVFFGVSFVCFVCIIDMWLLFLSIGYYVLAPLLGIVFFLSVWLGQVLFANPPVADPVGWGVCASCGATRFSVDHREDICVRCLSDKLSIIEDKVSYLMKVFDSTNPY